MRRLQVVVGVYRDLYSSEPTLAIIATI